MSERIERFEDFVAWQKTRILMASVYRKTDRSPSLRDRGLRDQIRRAAVSVMSNIAEGFEGGKPGEFQHFLSIAEGSCAKLRSQLYVARDVGYLDEHSFRELQVRAGEVARLVGGLRASAERRRQQL